MSRTDLDAVTLANSLRAKAGDGSIEWVSEPMQASVLLDIADMLDENARLKQELEAVGTAAYLYGRTDLADENAKLRKYVNAIAIQSYKGKMFDCGYCPFHNQCYNDEPKEHQGRGCQWWLWARELGIEVDG